ncbi:MAG: ASKHA domain-containing protein [Thermodesulfobacteriota bacterium]|nr:ASKHA domain-containing protein [Thermodesulfobacteriota bacterium]
MGINKKSLVRYIELTKPELSNNSADAERLKDALKKELKTEHISIPLFLAASLPEKLRKWEHRVKCVIFKELNFWSVAAIRDPEENETLCGVAADIGTTRVVLQLLDLETGEVINERGFDNPQAAIAPDVLARIHYAGKNSGAGLKELHSPALFPGAGMGIHGNSGSAGLKELQSLIINGINANILALCKESSIDPAMVYLFSGAGNTAMTHLFLGLDPLYIIREPYIPAVNAPEPVNAGELGLLINPGAKVFLFPNVGSYFGGDLMAGIFYSGLHKKENPCLMVDVGTNAEVVVGNRDWLMACAGAAGPALEGGVSDMGMTAGPGVIDRVKIDPETRKIDIHTIDEKPAIGICGSGMIDLAAELFLSGMLDIRGKFSKKRCESRLFEKRGVDCFRLVDKAETGTGDDIFLSQVDMNSLTSSKAAMHSILEVIVNQTAGLDFDELERFYVAGTFGSFINPQSAISIGMLPDMPLEKFEVLGNSSLKGAAKLLLDSSAFKEIEGIRDGITYIELNVNQEFMNIFSGAKFYPHTDRSRFPSVKLYYDET